MNRFEKIQIIRNKLRAGSLSLGSWMQLSDPSVAEIMGAAGYDWVAVDLEHGSISTSQLPDIFRALELGNTLPLARLANGDKESCKAALDSGAGGVIVPMVETAEQLETIIQFCRWPPHGSRGVGYSRANLFGANFDQYTCEARGPIVVAMIEHINAVKCLDEIVAVDGIDAIFVGPYDLSASMSLTGQFDNPRFLEVLRRIESVAEKKSFPIGYHIVSPCEDELKWKIAAGYSFLAFSIDAVMLNNAVRRPKVASHD